LASKLTIKQLILWRHADAEVATLGQSDLSRALTAKGVSQSVEMARWLNKHLPKHTLVLTSPAERTKQTARALDLEAHVMDILSPDTRYLKVLEYLTQSLSENVMLVGHQPWIGQLAALLLDFPEGELSVKKGAVWWLRLSNDGLSYKLHTVQTPQLMT
jgi:phosphohistidine phosphatase